MRVASGDKFVGPNGAAYKIAAAFVRGAAVEGKTDLYFIAELWRKQTGIDASKHFSIIASGGKEQLIQDVADFGNDRNNIWKSAPTTHLGIVIDADESAANTFQSVADALDRAGFTDFPKVLNSQGLICEVRYCS